MTPEQLTEAVRKHAKTVLQPSVAQAIVEELALDALREELSEALLAEAIARINDMLTGDDGQAYKEARKFVDRVGDAKEQP